MARRLRPVLSRLLRIPLMVLLAAALFATTSFNRPQPTSYPVYFLGDSLTAGRAATRPENGYRLLLLAHLRQNPRLTVKEEGVWRSGWRVADALAAAVANPPKAKTALVVVEIGTNDADGNLSPNPERATNPADFAADYALLIAYLRAEAPSAQFVCVSTWWQASRSAFYNDTIERSCPHGKYVDITPLYANLAYHGPAGLDESWYSPGQVTDVFHPNDAGMAVIARSIEASL
jgi:lysophospholipase L1-like esterase